MSNQFESLRLGFDEEKTPESHTFHPEPIVPGTQDPSLTSDYVNKSRGKTHNNRKKAAKVLDAERVEKEEQNENTPRNYEPASKIFFSDDDEEIHVQEPKKPLPPALAKKVEKKARKQQQPPPENAETAIYGKPSKSNPFSALAEQDTLSTNTDHKAAAASPAAHNNGKIELEPAFLSVAQVRAEAVTKKSQDGQRPPRSGYNYGNNYRNSNNSNYSSRNRRQGQPRVEEAQPGSYPPFQDTENPHYGGNRFLQNETNDTNERRPRPQGALSNAPRERREQRDFRGPRDPREPREFGEPRDSPPQHREQREFREPRQFKEQRDQREQREQRNYREPRPYNQRGQNWSARNENPQRTKKTANVITKGSLSITTAQDDFPKLE